METPLPQRAGGFTLLEMMLALLLLAVLGTLSVAGYGAVTQRMNVSRAVSDISEIQLLVSKFNMDFGRLPDTLAEAGAVRIDPWGNPYRYLNFTGLANLGAVRKDRNLVPINSDFDLYSSGPDGVSQPPLTTAASRDDIVRANDGRFIGKAEDY